MVKMVQEYTSPVRVYEYPFELVMAAYERRFPTCEMIPAFLGSDTSYEYVSEDGSIHEIERRCRLYVDAPYLLRKIAGIDHAVFIQRNCLNRRDRTLKIEARNETFETRLKIKENCYYSVHPDNSNWTLFEQDARLDIISFFGFEPLVEKVAIKAYTMNIKKGKEIIMHYINQLITEGKTYFPPFIVVSNEHTSSQTLNDSILIIEDSGSAKSVHSDDSSKTQTEVEIIALQDKDDGNNDVKHKHVNYITIKKNVEAKLSPPPPLQEYKLDDMYIARYLGELTTKEEAGLMQLRKRFQAMQLGKPPSESVLLRFLRARDANVEKALEMLKNSQNWRRQHHVDNISETWKPSENILEYYPGGWHQYDKDGRPLYIIRLGSMDVKGLLKTVGEDGFIKQVVAINEEGLLKCAEAADIFKKPVTDWTLLVDLDKLNLRHLWRPGIRALLRIIEVVEVNYPETKGQLLIVRAPKVFGVVWTLLSPFIDENTRKKFMIYSGDDYQGSDGLEEYISKEYIPKFLNGPCECNIPEGKLVPKEFYKFEHVGDATETTWLDTDLYQTAHVMKGTPHHVALRVLEAEAVITWDFDVIDGDCVFQVLRHKRPYVASNQNISCLGDMQRQSIRPGIDAQVVERPITCNQGDSLQGMHICNQPGLFLLEWKYLNPTRSRPMIKFHNKTKIMYYHKLLPLEDFMGSMSSMSSAASYSQERRRSSLKSTFSVMSTSL